LWDRVNRQSESGYATAWEPKIEIVRARSYMIQQSVIGENMVEKTHHSLLVGGRQCLE
jgi:hypothetical protein